MESKYLIFKETKENTYSIIAKLEGQSLGTIDYMMIDRIARFTFYPKSQNIHMIYIADLLNSLINKAFEYDIDEVRLYSLYDDTELIEGIGFKYLYTINKIDSTSHVIKPFKVYQFYRRPSDSIILLTVENFHDYTSLWQLDPQDIERWYEDIKTGNRMIYVYMHDHHVIGEAAFVFDSDSDDDYTISHQRIHMTRMFVKPEYRHIGIATKLANFMINVALNLGYEEISIGVDMTNRIALHLYEKLGFDQILSQGEDEEGKYVKLIKPIRQIK